MKTSFALFSILFLLSVTSLHAQETPVIPVQKVQVCQVDILFGGGASLNQGSTLADFQKLAPESKLLKGNFSNYQSSSFYGMGANSMFSVLMGLRFAKADKSGYKPSPLLRLGFTYLSSNNFAASYYQEETKRYDTLVSINNGQTYYLDSNLTRTYNMNYHSEQIRLDASLIYRTNPKARWSFYSGIGLNVGVSLNANTSIQYMPYNSASNGASYYYYPYPSPYNQTYSSTSETFRNSTNFGVSSYVPLAIDFRMGKKRPFWQRTHLFFEMRPGINVNSIPELGTFAKGYFQSAFGIRVNWEELQ